MTETHIEILEDNLINIRGKYGWLEMEFIFIEHLIQSLKFCYYRLNMHNSLIYNYIIDS